MRSDDVVMSAPANPEEATLFPAGDLYEKREMEEGDMRSPKSCKTCRHVLVCKAFQMVSDVQNQFNQECDFTKFPFPPESLGSACKEYDSIVNREL